MTERRFQFLTICLLLIAGSQGIVAQTKKPAFLTTSAIAATDWSKEMVESTIKRYPTAESLKGWGYAKSLYLYGQYLVYLRTKENRYLQHIKDWTDLHVDDKGVVNRPITALDYMLPANLCLILYKETKQEKYKLCADSVRRVFDTYPRTKDGGFWHANTKSREYQLWADGVFMGMPFLVRYGEMFGDSKYTDAEAVKQMLVYYKNLNDPATGLLWHAYDESLQQAWANKQTKVSAEHWARAIGWYAMTLINILDIIPKNQPDRDELIRILNQLSTAFERYQDKDTGLWWQVVDKGTVPGNWLETSSSSMYTFAMWMGVERGYLPKTFREVALNGYKGVLSKVSLGEDGMTNLVDVSEGTNVSDIDYYFARKRPPNDFHGIGAFLIMNEYLRTSGGGKTPKLDWTAK
ncbi:MAG: glycoside hydrolase family 105 protein [Pyrinomonadaceae bacterium]